jgi:predicted  nucleic acid-binding Zn-ribbon protein
MEAQLPDQTPAITFRIIALERDVTALKDQLNRYVPVRENELQLKSMRDTVDRIERDVQEARRQLEGLNAKLIMQDREAQERDATQRESQSALQIKVLWGTVSTVIVVLTSILIGYVTHLFR